jgi:UDP-3-O-[3-hydroxymyristoyl] N-acetylglucosamine deacetylase
MHTALVQRLLRDRSAWEFAHGYDEMPDPAKLDPALLRTSVPAHA